MIELRIGWPRRIGSPTELRRFGADESNFGQKSDLITKKKTKIFEKPIRFNLIKQYVNLIELKPIKSNAIFNFFVKSDRIHFYFFVGSENKNCFRSDPMAPLTAH